MFARSGMDQAVIRVIGVRDGLPREGAEVTVYDVGGGMRAKGATDASGMARFDSLSWPTPCADCVDGWRADSFDGHVEVRSGRDRALAILGEAVPESGRIYRWGSRGGDRAPATVRVIADRPRYRPGETIHAKVVARVGTSGALGVPRGDSIRWKFYDAKGALLEDQVHALSDFGTAARSFRIDPDAPLGSYRSEIQLFRAGSWRTMTRQGVDVEEYRTPEFLVSLVASDSAVTVGDSVTVTAQGRYLFEAPMVGADVEWRISAIPVFEVARLIPGMQGWVVGDANRMESDPEVTADTLDGRGEAFIRFRAEPRGMPLPYRSIVQATVTDANRQTMTDRVDVVVHPASWYVGVREPEEAGPWVAERPVSVDVVVVDQQGRRVPDVRVRGVLVLTDSPARGEVADTVANCSVTTAVEPVSCTFVPPGRGTYELVLEVTDPDGRSSITILRRWVGTRMGFPGFGGPGEEETWVSVDRGSYTVGDTAVLTVTSPFGEGDAWVAVMQERILESRVLRVGGDTVQIRIPVDEGMIPMAQVSVVFSRPVDSRFRVLPDSVNVRQVAAWIMVDPSPKWLEVRVTPEEPEYQPGDSARFSVSVRDQGGAGVPAEVMLWAVDEGEMAATSWELPDPVSLMYERKNGAIVASSNLTVVGAETRRWANRGRVALASSVQGVSLDEIVVTGAAAVGVGQSPTAVIVRHDFRSTAFFLASIVTDEEGNAAAAAKLPDNLTTFRVMAVAVSREDRFGSGESKIVVDLPLM
ncbi:MAG: MG2 domain-containing protein, partial [Gemmatimonadota bacterium]|nr:MG2 domain-containing protein [Gemmatimonadota bacterium]